jgi:UDP-MurNAc hydroxylase
MKIHVIGHASLFVETQDAKILMDPVLWDPFCEGLNESCPKRETIPEALPEFDILVISHQHLDHFDLRSLAYLPKHVDVFLPHDPLIIQALQGLGYPNIYPLFDFQKVKIGATTLMPTRSEIRVPEFGMVFADPSGVFWNTVDTYFAPPTISKVRESFPQIDFLLATWHISLEGKFQFNQDCAFPFDLYQQLFQLLQLVDPKAIAPGASGLKYINEAAWQNQVVFPVTRERFCQDLAQVMPQVRDTTYVLDPGDIFTFDQGTYDLSIGACDYVRMVVDDRELIEFCPVNVGHQLTDQNLPGYDVATMVPAVEQAISQDLIHFIREHLSSHFAIHRQWQVIYQLTLVDPSGGSRQWHIDFTQPEIAIHPGRNPLASYFVHITASALYSLMQAEHDWDYLLCSGEYRQFHKIYNASPTGLSQPVAGSITDPIGLLYPSQNIASQRVAAELAKLHAQNQVTSIDASIPPSSMLNLGNIMFRVRRDRAEATAQA